jgi:uncharacterized protein YoxC
MESFVLVAMSTPSIVLRYAAAFFFVVVAIAAAYALFKAGKVLDRADTVLDDVDQQAMPLLMKAGTTLDEVNGSLGNVDQITKDVANTTDRLDKMATAVEGAVATPARKAAAFSAGVQSAVSSFMKRESKDSGAAPESGTTAGAGWSRQPSTEAADAVSSEAAGPPRRMRLRRRTTPSPPPVRRARARPWASLALSPAAPSLRAPPSRFTCDDATSAPPELRAYHQAVAVRRAALDGADAGTRRPGPGGRQEGGARP